MSKQVASIANELLTQLHHLMDRANFDKSVFSEYGSSAFESHLAMNLPKNHKSRDKKFEDAEADFEKLYQSLTHLTKRPVRYISFAYGLILRVIEASVEHQESEDAVRALVDASLLIGQAIPILEMSAFVNIFADDAERKLREEMQERNKKSREARNMPFDLLRNWALEMAKTSLEDDMELSKLLADQVPEHIDQYVKKTRGRKIKGDKRVISNHQRIIYEALLDRHKPVEDQIPSGL